MTGLPPSWVGAPLLTVSELLRGVTYTKDVVSSTPAPDCVPVLRATNLQGRALDLDELVYVPKSYVSTQQFLRAGDVVVATSSGSISVVGKAVAVSKNMNASFGAFCGVVRPSAAIDPGYFGHFFSSEEYRSRVSSMARGVNINNLKREHFESLTLPLAPEAEQQRIVAKLNTLLSRVDACHERLERVGPLIKRFRRSVLLASASGRLTEGSRISKGWKQPVDTTLGAILKVSSGKSLTAKAMAANGTVPVYGGNGITGFHDEANVTEPTLVVGRVGFYCGSVHLTPARAWVTDNALVVRHDPATTLRSFLWITLSAANLRANDASTAQPVISGAKIYPLPVTLPSLDEQAAMVAHVDRLLGIASELETRLDAARKSAGCLTPATLAKAFRGELVPQDPTDEPADQLLARIRAERAAATTQTPPRKPGRQAKATNQQDTVTP